MQEEGRPHMTNLPPHKSKVGLSSCHLQSTVNVDHEIQWESFILMDSQSYLRPLTSEVISLFSHGHLSGELASPRWRHPASKSHKGYYQLPSRCEENLLTRGLSSLAIIWKPSLFGHVIKKTAWFYSTKIWNQVLKRNPERRSSEKRHAFIFFHTPRSPPTDKYIQHPSI